MMMHKTRLTTLSATGALLAALALAGCDRPADQQQGAAPGDRSTAAADPQGRGGELHADAARARDRMAQANQDVQGAGRSAADSATNAVSDAAITAQVNAQLAKDPNLSAMTIDVDTSGGQVALHGTAPDATSKERATTLAQGVKGVQSVDNQLTVAPKRP
jgi:hyperosmotically inducible periplasmic protein